MNLDAWEDRMEAEHPLGYVALMVVLFLAVLVVVGLAIVVAAS
jgi:hypothetical protein